MTRVGFIGTGQMAKALGCGIAKSNSNLTFVVADPIQAAVDSFRDAVGESVNVLQQENNRDVFVESEIVFLAMKPQYFEAALNPAELETVEDKLVVSIVAGVEIEKITAQTGSQLVVRTMPNTPCLVGCGAIGMACSQSVTSEQKESARKLLETTGVVVEVEEDLLDSVTGLSGSGPGYVFEFIESLILGGVAQGLSREMSQQLTIQTVLGAAKLANETGDDPVVLRDRVTSPGGTTQAGLAALADGGFRDLIQQAVKSATLRSKELG